MRRGFTIHHNGPPANCIGRDHSRCIAFWNAVKAFHTNPEPIGKGWSDIAYSFGACPHGIPFIGRGWDRSQWANGSDQVGPDNGDDRYWYSVLVFVGGDTSTNDTEPPTREMINATAALIQEGRATGRCGFAVTPHNLWKRKPCPGPEFTALAHAWNGVPNLPILTPPSPTPPPPTTPKEHFMRDAINFYVRNESNGAVLFVMRNLTDPDRPFSCMGVDAASWDSTPEDSPKWGVSDADFAFFVRYRIDNKPVPE